MSFFTADAFPSDMYRPAPVTSRISADRSGRHELGALG
jgi:hypothetical protein